MKQSEIVYLIKKTPTLTKSFQKIYCGDFLGQGVTRSVYVFKPDDRFVIKLEPNISKNGFAFVNVGEWHNWLTCMYFSKMADFLAPCLTINQSSQILIQRRAIRTIDGDKRPYPKYIPNWLTDTKKFNFGWIGDKFVCVDYPHLIARDFKMKRAKYW